MAIKLLREEGMPTSTLTTEQILSIMIRDGRKMPPGQLSLYKALYDVEMKVRQKRSW